ncbi:hypothetical protein FANTH_7206 [Fusarium anthophilum]|uniref:RanBP2-type domain-containing protein n=1 Tax=Fusarium anthophilum TaxID=48485 RepID=A0A8H4ZGV6_9HYPO|nr:hypothetical protein FANTH_7206 [Fusarium anthophilum]
MSKPTEVNIAYWLCMNVNCTKQNDIDSERCKKCKAELAKGAKALDADIDDIGECEGIDLNGKPVWKLHEAKTVDLWDARAKSTYGWDYHCHSRRSYHYGQDNKGCAIRVPLLGCPKCKLARRIGTLALRDNWEIIGHLEDYTSLGEEVWEYDVPYDVNEPDPVLYRLAASFGDGDIKYDDVVNDRTANGN